MSSSPSDFRDFIIWERESHDTIDFKKIYVDMAADLKAGLMLSQIIYWRLPRKNRSAEDSRLSIERDGRMWLAKSDNEWWKEIRLTDKEARSARMVLEQRGLVMFQNWKFAGRPCTHISINEDRFMELWEQMRNTPIEEREAGRVEPKIKREKAKKPGSKPTSGNWRKNQPPAAPDQEEGGESEAAQVAEQVSEDEPAGESGLYEKGKVDITESVKSTLPKGQSPHYPKGNMNFTESGESYTENTAEIPSEIPAKNLKSSSSVPVDAGTDWLPDDDDFPADAEPQNPNPTPEALHRPDPVQPSSQAAETPPPTDPENVPGAAAGGAAPAWAILALPVIPRRELEGRAPRDPSGIPQLRALLHCSHKSRLPQLQVELEAATRSGIPRSLLTRLTDKELKAATSAAKTDAPKVDGGFARAGIHALHRLIGEPLTPNLLKGEKEPARDVRGAAYDVKNEPSGKAAQVETLPPPSPVSIEAGSRWEHRRQQDKVVTVVGIKSGKVEFHNGEQVLAYQLTKDYRRVD